jgi:hypothetical protein
VYNRIVNRFAKWREHRFFRKHQVGSWKEYYYKYDPDFNIRADTILEMFHGYPYIVELQSLQFLKAGFGDEFGWDLDAATKLTTWLETKCKGKARAKIERVLPHTGVDYNGNKFKNWAINEFATDSLFVGFQDERDYLIFLLKWECA